MPILPHPVLSREVLSDLNRGRLDAEDEEATRWGAPGDE
eukprot:CAMPEP_0118634674 /NCGR_PEP_ID=MMETSP0785-20121206/1674_1 /TAXON_ID=91992 /ORGANISM="Bolidomonas pacifica, Strain CCMP 1866" /LENGTH=38 /DNA_ID= /DNA_START= /DNA_END= /DNA_ORIENTATION=